MRAGDVNGRFSSHHSSVCACPNLSSIMVVKKCGSAGNEVLTKYSASEM